MARIRSVHPGLFTDEAFMAASPHARLFLIGLWTEADDQGVFEWKMLTLKARILPVDAVDVPAILAELEELTFIRGFEHAGRKYGAIRNFRRYQRPKKPNSIHPVPADLREFLALDDGGSEEIDDEPANIPDAAVISSEPVRNRFGTSGVKPPQMDDGGDKREKEERLPIASQSRAVDAPPAPAKRAVGDAFDRFWKAYPKRDGANPRKPAADKFAARARSGVDPEAMIAAAQRYAIELAAKGKIGTVYVAQAVTWLNQDRFGDYATAAAPVSTGPPAAPKPPREGMQSDAELRAKYSVKHNAPIPAQRPDAVGPAVFPDGGSSHRSLESGWIGPMHGNPSERSGMVSLGSVLPRSFAMGSGRNADGGERVDPVDDRPVQVAGMAR